MQILRERPDQPEVVALLDELDRYLASLYAPEDNHILDVQALLAPEVSFFVARQGAQIVATGAVRSLPGEPATDGQSYGEIKRMMVLPSCRGQGIGWRMLAALEAELRSAGIGLALLETGSDQHAAVALYERCGFVQRAAFGGYPDNGLSLFYAKAL